MLDVALQPDPQAGPAKQRTSSCSTEESGIDSLSPPESSIACSACSSPGGPAPPSEAESETSDYPRQSPGPSSEDKGEIKRRLKVEPTEKAEIKKVKLEEEDAVEDARMAACSGHCSHPPRLLRNTRNSRPNTKLVPQTNSKLLKGGLAVKSEAPDESESHSMNEEKTMLEPFDTDLNLKAKTEDMKLEIAKIDSILQGKLLLDKSSHNLSEMLLLDKFKSGYPVKHEIFTSFEPKQEKCDLFHSDAISGHAKIIDTSPLPGYTGLSCSHNNNNITSKSPARQQNEPGDEAEKHEPGGFLDNQGNSGDREYVDCKWKGCGKKFEVQNFLEHLTDVHVSGSEGDVGRGRVACLWAGCKVYGVESISSTWLSKHVTSHVGSKPFLCIVSGCRLRFGNQVSLSRHVNSHFKPPCGPPHPPSTKKSADSNPVKYYVRKSRRKTRTLGTGQPAHGLDLFDIGIMAGIKESLSRIKKKSKIQRKKKILNEINFDSCGNSVILNGHVTSRKQDENGTVHYLVSWLPQGLLAAEWISQRDYKTRKKVLISQLPPDTKDKLEDYIFGSRKRCKNQRKPPRKIGPPKLT